MVTGITWIKHFYDKNQDTSQSPCILSVVRYFHTRKTIPCPPSKLLSHHKMHLYQKYISKPPSKDWAYKNLAYGTWVTSLLQPSVTPKDSL